MKRLSTETKKEIMHFFLTTATKRLLDERQELHEKSIEMDKRTLKNYLGSNIT